MRALGILLLLLSSAAAAQTLEELTPRFLACQAHHHPQIENGILVVRYDSGFENCKQIERQFAEANCQHFKQLKAGSRIKFRCASDAPDLGPIK